MDRMTSEETGQLRQRVEDEKFAQFMTMATGKMVLQSRLEKIHANSLIMSDAEVCLYGILSHLVKSSGSLAPFKKGQVQECMNSRAKIGISWPCKESTVALISPNQNTITIEFRPAIKTDSWQNGTNAQALQSGTRARHSA